MWYINLCVIFSDFCFVHDPTTKRCVFDCFEDDSALSKLPAPPANCGDEKLGPHYEVEMGYVYLSYRYIDGDINNVVLDTARSKMTRAMYRCKAASS